MRIYKRLKTMPSKKETALQVRSNSERKIPKLKFIDAKNFFKEYLPEIKSVAHKLRGKNGRGNPVEFSKDELKQIDKAIMKMARDSVKL